MREITTTVYNFTELSKEAQSIAIASCRDGEEEWTNQKYLIEDITFALSIIGFNNVEISYSGFYSPGDGLSFISKYSRISYALRAIKREFPTWTELHDATSRLQKLNIKSQEITRITHRYYHENTITCDNDNFLEVARELCKLFYKYLQDAYEYDMGEENIREILKINDYEFTKEGEIK